MKINYKINPKNTQINILSINLAIPKILFLFGKSRK